MNPAEQELLNAIDGPVIAADRNGRITYFSTEAEELLGWQAEDVLDSPLTRIMPERMRSAHEQGFQRYVETGESRLASRTVRVPALCPDRSEKTIDLSIHLLRRSSGADLIVATLARPRKEKEVVPISDIGEASGKGT